MTPLPLPLQCEHPHLIALNPFIGNDIIAIVVTQCERTLMQHYKDILKCRINFRLVHLYFKLKCVKKQKM